jgi:hypothetical protein
LYNQIDVSMIMVQVEVVAGPDPSNLHFLTLGNSTASPSQSHVLAPSSLLARSEHLVLGEQQRRRAHELLKCPRLHSLEARKIRRIGLHIFHKVQFQRDSSSSGAASRTAHVHVRTPGPASDVLYWQKCSLRPHTKLRTKHWHHWSSDAMIHPYAEKA